jgi:DNA polymerase-3 subunit epsilon
MTKISESENLKVDYYKKVIFPSENELQKHKEYLKDYLKKNNFN